MLNTMVHTVHYNGMVWQVRGPFAERGDDFTSRNEALAVAHSYNARADRMAAPAQEWCDACHMNHGIELQPCYE